jgi:preprotein translocase subunit Sec61beta
MTTHAMGRPRLPRLAITIGLLVGLAVLLATQDAGGPAPYVLLAVALLVAVYRYLRGPAGPWDGNDEV